MRQKIKVSKVCITAALMMGVIVSTMGNERVGNAEEMATPVPTAESSTEPTASALPTATVQATATTAPTATVQPAGSPTPVPTSTALPVITNLAAPDVTKVVMSGDKLAASFTYVDNCYGYEVEVCKKSNGQVVKSGAIQSTVAVVNSLPRNAVYYVHARAFAQSANGSVVYSEWGSKGFAVSQPEFNKAGSKLKKKSIKLKWGKVAGANKYMIDMRKRGTKKWYHTKNVSSKKNSCTIKKFRGKKFNSYKTDYELRIRATAKINGKTYKSSGSHTVYTYTYRI